MTQTFEEWLESRDEDAEPLPLVAWGPQHSKIAQMYAADVAAASINHYCEVINQALNEGDGVYRP